MKNILSFFLSFKLFTKLYLIMASSTVMLVVLVVVLTDYAERELSLIEPEYQQVLRSYASEASAIYRRYPDEAQRHGMLNSWLKTLMEKENTWAAMGRTEAIWLAGKLDTQLFGKDPDLSVGRSIHYPIHLYFSFNPVMKLPMPETDYFLFIQLPQRMRPGSYWQAINHSITYGLPILLVALFAALIYRHIRIPLALLQNATNRFRDGDYEVRIGTKMFARQDELSELGQSFDTMADHIGVLVQRQQQLIQDISHELRTPITRIKLALGDNLDDPVLQRVSREVDGMQSLLEDTLTLSWLNNADCNTKKEFTQETLDVCLLIDAIAEDARFEFPDNILTLSIPEECIVNKSNHRALGQALENIIRNAMKYSPVGSEVEVLLTTEHDLVKIIISDQGPGVEEQYLEAIFEPFFRVDKARNKDTKTSGYGLGLALSRRQVEALGGHVTAHLKETNQPGCSGLVFEIILPMNLNSGGM